MRNPSSVPMVRGPRTEINHRHCIGSSPKCTVIRVLGKGVSSTRIRYHSLVQAGNE